MKICFVLNNIKTETCGTSVIILRKAHQRGHQVYVMGVDDFIYHKNNGIYLSCKEIPENIEDNSLKNFWKNVQDEKLKSKVIFSGDLDILFLRNNPTEEPLHRYWAGHCGMAFARMIQKTGVLVLNDAVGLSKAYIDKLYFEEFPAEIKPESLITRKREEILKFWEKNQKEIILKPLEGSGGRDVYKIGKEKKNLNQILDNILRKGYVIAQEYLPEAKNGDIRVILMNGKILQQDDQLAIIRRVSKDKSEFRSNLTLGGIPKKAKITPEIEHIVSLVGPKLIRDGLFFVGLDIVKDKLIEINVLSPGGIDHYQKTGMTDFTDSIVKALERKIQYKRKNKGKLKNTVLATME